MTRLRVVVTGAGAPGIRGTLYSLRHNPDDRAVAITGTDIVADCVGRHFVDDFHVVPPPEDAAYLSRLIEVVRRTGADVVLPQTTREVVALSRVADGLRREGVAVAVTPAPFTEAADSKWTLLQACTLARFPAPRGRLARDRDDLAAAARELGYPDRRVVAKLPHSNGMRGLRVLADSAWDAERFRSDKPSGVEISLDELTDVLGRGSQWPELLVTEFLPGPEYTVDVFRGTGGTTAVARLRASVRSGITFEADVRPDAQVAAMSCALGDLMNLRFAFGFQWKEDAEGVPRILECNPRVQGTMVASTLAGVNVTWLAVREAIGEPVSEAELSSLRPRPISFRRFWGGGAELDGRFVEI